jgi:hypothetical protein
MKKFLSLLVVFYSTLLFSQTYWQQEVKYNIDVSLDDKNHFLKGFLKLDYTNNSPDKLSFIWFHVWPNAYKNEETPFAKQVLEQEGKKGLKKLKENGFMDSLSFYVNNEKAEMEAHPEYPDVIKLKLRSALEPKATIHIATPFFVKIPSYISRMGRDEQFYMICQWYPKPAVYDRKGWHPMPYLDQGEFYSEFGSFTVNITVPSAYIIAATGVLQNTDELNQYKKMGRMNVAKGSTKNVVRYEPGTAAKKTLQYQGENIHDFAWFADKEFVVRYDSLQIELGQFIDVFAWHHPDGNKNWKFSTDYIRDAVFKYSEWVGDYPYPVVQAVEGPKNDNSGGMEYPMITLITSPDANEANLDGVIAHEVGHNWFYGILGSNERTHPWMDEGLNTYYQLRYEATKYNNLESIFGDAMPAEVRSLPPDALLDVAYKVLAQTRMWEAIDTPADQFKDKQQYGLVEYIKTAIWLHGIETGLGNPTLSSAIKAYFDQWKFKHPYPEDLKQVFETTTGQNVDKYFSQLKKTGNLQ